MYRIGVKTPTVVKFYIEPPFPFVQSSGRAVGHKKRRGYVGQVLAT